VVLDRTEVGISALNDTSIEIEANTYLHIINPRDEGARAEPTHSRDAALGRIGRDQGRRRLTIRTAAKLEQLIVRFRAAALSSSRAKATHSKDGLPPKLFRPATTNAQPSHLSWSG
jgi:hypothetical protein